MADNNHVILNHLDAPARILFWPISEFMSAVAPLVLLVIVGHPALGVVVGGAVALCIRRFKRSFGKGVLEGFLYWHSVHNKSLYPVTPPSFIREYIE
jgi:type IV conjugative transfer system protein TraL